MRHGPHQGAQTSTRTGMVFRAIWRSKLSAATSSGCPRNTLTLHFPHLASMAGRDGGKRLIVPHLLQTTRFSVICSCPTWRIFRTSGIENIALQDSHPDAAFPASMSAVRAVYNSKLSVSSRPEWSTQADPELI